MRYRFLAGLSLGDPGLLPVPNLCCLRGYDFRSVSAWLEGIHFMNCAYRRLRLRLFSLVIGGAVLFGCWSALGAKTHADGTWQQARVGREFKLKAGERVTLKRNKLRIKFAAVTQESRCPVDVTCVWAGNAAVRLDVSTNRSNGKSLTLNTGRSSSLPREAVYQGYKVKLVDLSPYPRSDRKIAPGDYVVTLLVNKN